jgi:sulfate transport system permease protein
MASALAPGLRFRQPSVIPGFGLMLGLTVTYLSLIVLIPLGAMFLRTATLSWPEFWAIASDPRTVAALRLSFGAAGIAAMLNLVMGTLVAWVLVRYSPIGVVVALTFIGLPFVVRTVQPVIQDLQLDVEEAAATLGATRLQTLTRVVLPSLAPAMLTGAAMAFARAVGEYGSVIFIAGNLPHVSEIAPLLIIIKLEEFDYAGATAIGTIMLGVSFAMLLVINLIQSWSRRRMAA